ncbi:MAG: DUF4917 family protein [Ignavibacteria bacterium]|nr:DUF4917 family protein [Ignavibacteria bacterium]
MKDIEIQTWKQLELIKWDALVIGNGASISIHEEFAYTSLHDIAHSRGLLPTSKPIFSILGTTDFEHVLLACWYAQQVNEALRSNTNDVDVAYKEVRSALIQAVNVVHPACAKVDTQLKLIGEFACQFNIIASLNYDLTLYWAIMQYNSKHPYSFKDAFIKGEFDADWREYLSKPYNGAKGASMVFYPHGNLAIARRINHGEVKISSSQPIGGDLLEVIVSHWESGEYMPVFVSEGSSVNKLAAIHRSRYLNHVYERVLPKLGMNIVVYGWSFCR